MLFKYILGHAFKDLRHKIGRRSPQVTLAEMRLKWNQPGRLS